MREPKPIPKNVKLIFGVLLLLGGLASGLGGGQIEKIRKAHASLSWPQTEGEVLASRVESRTGRTGSGSSSTSTTSYFADILYEYQVGGVRYTSKGVSYGDYGSSDRDRVEGIVHRYPAGKKV